MCDENPYHYERERPLWLRWKDANETAFHGNRLSKYKADHTLKRPPHPNDNNPYSHRTNTKQYYAWRDANDPTFLGNRYSKFNKAGELKHPPRPTRPPRPTIIFSSKPPKSIKQNPFSKYKQYQQWRDWRARAELKQAFKPKLPPEPIVVKQPGPLQHSVIEKQFFEDTGITIEEQNLENIMAFYQEELTEIIQHSEPTPLLWLLDRYKLDPKFLRRNGIIQGHNTAIRLSPIVYEKLGIPIPLPKPKKIEIEEMITPEARS